MSSKVGSSRTQKNTVKAQTKMQQAVAFHQQGQLVKAQALYEEMIKVEPTHFRALNLLGMVAAQTNNLTKAVDLISQSIALKSDYAEAYCNLGNVLQGLGQLESAIINYDQAIAIKPAYAEAYFSRGVALKSLQRLEAAIASYDQAIYFNPSYVAAYYNRGNVLKELGRLTEAVASYNQVILLRTDHLDAYFNRGVALYGLMQFDSAISSYDRVIELKPLDSDAYYNRGVALNALGQLTAAIASYDQAIAIRPAYAEVYINRGVALKSLGQFDAAIASYDKAHSLKPDNTEGHWNKSILNLLRGNFAQGWQDYEWRWKRDSSLPKNCGLSQPLWLGKESLKDKVILLHSEQGLGDTLQFCRYVKLVSDLGARVVLTVPKPLMGLLSELDGVDQLVAKGSALPEFDFHCPLLSLPLAFKTNLESIPHSTHYLTCNASKVVQWQAKLGSKTKPRVGLVWSGSTTLINDHNRSILLADLVKHLPVDFQYVSLQKEVRDVDLSTLQSHADIFHFENDLNDFSDTAALCEAMDVIVSVDTSVAHLAGALGKPVWVLLPFDPDWRWLLDRTDSPWYPSAKLYRQAKIGDWEGVFHRLGADLIQAFKPI
jgi:tetratricopeptide (TPR) repeat protein